MEIENSDLPQLFDYSAAAEVLHLSHFTLRRWVSEKRVKHIKMGSKVFFSRAQLAQIITDKDVEPVAVKS